MLSRTALPVLAGAWFLILSVVTAAGVRADEELCLGCHDPAEEIVEPEYQIDPEAWRASLHAEMGFACTECHSGIEDYPHEEHARAHCSDCHEDARQEFLQSSHAYVDAFGDEPCGVCHTVHAIRANDDPESRLALGNQPDTCAQCHEDVGIVGVAGLDTRLIVNFQESVHGRAGREGSDRRPAVCADCHNGHLVHRASHPESTTNPFRIPQTCAQCHQDVVDKYERSVHWKAFEHGRTAAPTCTVCHGIHTIKHVPGPDASAAEAHLVRTTCTGCHSSEALMSEFGVPEARVKSYDASYHGLVKRRGGKAVADCASCHGIHEILPSSDPLSSVAPERLQETCGQCHPGAGAQFARSPVHFVEGGATDRTEFAIVLWVKRIYWGLLFGVLGGMVLHNLIIMGWYVRRKWREEHGKRMRRRFSLSQIIQHAALVTSFAVLVFTGFMLAYPDSWWARLIAEAGLGEWGRRTLHRSAAVVMIAASLVHLYWMVFTSYGRQELRRIAPKTRDVRELMQNMRYHLGSSRQRPAFAKYDYPAKAEYWALVWGTIVMALTGLVLWFPVVATSIFPNWILKVSEVVHLFEAWLATLAILIFHFFYVFGHPEVYPFNFAMFHGGMSEEMAEHEHPGWAEEESPRGV